MNIFILHKDKQEHQEELKQEENLLFFYEDNLSLREFYALIVRNVNHHIKVLFMDMSEVEEAHGICHLLQDLSQQHGFKVVLINPDDVKVDLEPLTDRVIQYERSNFLEDVCRMIESYEESIVPEEEEKHYEEHLKGTIAEADNDQFFNQLTALEQNALDKNESSNKAEEVMEEDNHEDTAVKETTRGIDQEHSSIQRKTSIGKKKRLKQSEKIKQLDGMRTIGVLGSIQRGDSLYATYAIAKALSKLHRSVAVIHFEKIPYLWNEEFHVHVVDPVQMGDYYRLQHEYDHLVIHCGIKEESTMATHFFLGCQLKVLVTTKLPYLEEVNDEIEDSFYKGVNVVTILDLPEKDERRGHPPLVGIPYYHDLSVKSEEVLDSLLKGCY